jgi:hypothetical protein
MPSFSFLFFVFVSNANVNARLNPVLDHVCSAPICMPHEAAAWHMDVCCSARHTVN